MTYTTFTKLLLQHFLLKLLTLTLVALDGAVWAVEQLRARLQTSLEAHR